MTTVLQRFLPTFLLLGLAVALNDDGVLLLSFKYSVLEDPFGALLGWSYFDDTPCAWNGVECAGTPGGSRVVGVRLPGAGIAGGLPPDLFAVEHLRHLDLSGNALNGSLPAEVLSAPELRELSLAGNDLSGRLPELCNCTALERLDMSGNGLAGNVPACLSRLPNLTTVDLSRNYLVGPLPGGFRRAERLDLSSNLINGSLPAAGLGGAALRLLNLSGNELSGGIPAAFGAAFPAGAIVDLSSNRLAGGIPAGPLAAQVPRAFSGNPGLCGRPLGSVCANAAAGSVGAGDAPPAFAAMPRVGGPSASPAARGLPPAGVAGIAGGVLLVVGAAAAAAAAWRAKRAQWRRRGEAESETEAGSEEGEAGRRKAVLVTVDGEAEMEMETLLKASAYILGASGASIVYKAVLADGTALAVRRIGEGGGGERAVKEFEAQVRAVARLRHPNLVAVRGFFWGPEERLLISEYVPNGSLAAFSYRKAGGGGSSPYHLPWDARLRVARGVARGLAYLHDKKAVHGNLKPSNILLGHDLEPKISDYGLARLLNGGQGTGIAGGSSSRGQFLTGSFRNFGSKRSSISNGSIHEPSPAAASPLGAAAASATPYLAPELYRSIKPSAKWDVYSFGVLLLELLTGRAPSEAEVGEWSESLLLHEEGKKAARMVDGAVRGELEGKEEAVASCFKLALACTATSPQRRPAMKEVVQALEKIS